MGPDDANVKGNVHGGNILNMIEQAGAVVATRYCNEMPHRVSHFFSTLSFFSLIVSAFKLHSKLNTEL